MEKSGNKKKLITSALPYVNNVPHLGNLLQVLSADVFARFCRLRGYETLYICGTDEYGTATETKALEEGISPRELCDRYYEVHRNIYRWFNINFDKFGRTSIPEHTEITQRIFNRLDQGGYIAQKTERQLFCPRCSRFLADRYVRGTCPSCGYEGARGDQCESCGKLLNPAELMAPRCGVCSGAPVFKETTHLYINLPAILPKLEGWLAQAAVKGDWARNAVQMTKSWIRDGLQPRAITRDLKWGIPVPKEGFTDKVFYVWFDAPIGYISITAGLTGEWEKWWKDPDGVELFQFIGKDNIPFHTVIFPSSLLGSGENWTMLHHVSSSEYLNYESGKFSKDRGIGIFGDDAAETGIPADVWRFYLFYNRPETADYQFTWKDFQEKVNSELIGNLANLVNRTLTFVYNNFGSRPPFLSPASGESPTPPDEGVLRFSREAQKAREEITACLEKAELREGLRRIFALTSGGNKLFQEAEPWKAVKTNPASLGPILRELLILVRDLGILLAPYLPAAAEKIASFFGPQEWTWDRLGADPGPEIGKPEILFSRLEDARIDELRKKFSGTQKEREEERAAETAPPAAGAKAASPAEAKAAKAAEALPPGEPPESPEDRFRKTISLRAAKITAITRHPEADKLYIETISLGEEERQIVSGLVPYYKEEELLGRNIILAANLKPAKLRGKLSQGMLLAADGQTPEGAPLVEVLFADHAQPGDPVELPGGEGVCPPDEIKAEAFFSVPIRVKGGRVMVGETPLVCGGTPLTTSLVKDGEVH
ncbi:MAG: methionine--tRNA ligase [Spirochaetales bacterium]|jgi:methionyl-tRNA synthetase|nr:methionine--tRNA ligase [Spirochaetales bacterium]